MPGFDLGGTVNSAADWVSSAPIVRTIINNPVLTALLITAIVAVLVLGTYYDKVRQGGTKQAVRTTLYVFFFVSAVMFVHHYAVCRSARDATAHKGVRDVFAGIQASRDYEGGTPVMPWGYEAPATGGAARAANVAPPGEAPGDAADELVIEDIVLPSAMH
jgi:hypothetical protein